jgi:predicted RNA binding protein YcfA (HicA-like mRNA interferase family)
MPPSSILTNSRDIIRKLLAEGWEEVSVKGSHHKFRRSGQSLIVPHPKKDLPIGTARNIARMAGWLKETP